MRIDKFIWCIRLSKTRSLATELCHQEKIKLNDTFIKPSKEIKANDTLAIKENPIWRTFMIIDVPPSRVGATLVANYLLETTDKKDLEQLEVLKTIQRENKLLGIKGRPTKKNRRDLDQLF
jgi:ribosome-associated heat shock protein Hsp15